MPGPASPDFRQFSTSPRGESASDPLKGVLGQIEAVIHPEAVRLKKMALQIQVNVDQTIEGGDQAWQENRAALVELAEGYMRSPLEKPIQERYITGLASSLFYEQRTLYKERTGSLDSYQTEKELRQIEAVLSILEGKHLHMGTGEGKSSVVIPTAAIIEAELGRGAQVTIASATGALVSELEHYTQILFQRANRDGIVRKAQLNKPDDQVMQAFKEHTGRHKSRVEYLNNAQAYESIISDTMSQRIADQECVAYWASTLNVHSDPSKEVLRSSDGVPIVFSDQTQLVFEWMREGRASPRTGRILIDEAHVPFDRNTPYLTSEDQLQADYGELRAQTVDWMIHYIVAQNITEADIIADKGTYLLTSEAIDKFAELKLGKYLDPEDSAHQTLKRGVDLAMNWFYPDADKRDPEEITQFRTKLTDLIASGIRQIESQADSEPYLSAAQRLAEHFKKQDRSYIPREKGGVDIRDEYTDQMLYDQSYRDLDRIAVSALAGSFEVVPPKMSGGNARYASFVNAKRDQIVCLSGTLMHADPEGGAPHKGAFAHFLERITQRDVAQITQIQAKNAPSPVLVDEKPSSPLSLGLYDKLFMDLNLTGQGDPKKPTLIVDYRSLSEAEETYRNAVKRYGADRVAMIVPQPVGGDDPQAEQEYTNKLRDVVGRLAEGQIDVLVSSGSVSLGVNIVREDGQYPDLQTVCIGMPRSPAQIMQLAGRRRRSEGTSVNHRWYITPGSLDEFFGIYDKEGLHVGIEIKKSRERMKEIILSERNPQTLRKLVLNLLERKAREEEEDALFYVDYDRLFYQEDGSYNPVKALSARTVEELVFRLPGDVRVKIHQLRDAVLDKDYQHESYSDEMLRLGRGIEELFETTTDKQVKRSIEQLYARVFVFGSLMGARGVATTAAKELVYKHVEERFLWGEGASEQLDKADLKTRMRVAERLVDMFGLPDDLYHDLAAYPNIAPDNRIQAQESRVARMRIIADALNGGAFSLKKIMGAWCEDNQDRILTEVRATQLIETETAMGALHAEYPHARFVVGRLYDFSINAETREEMQRGGFTRVSGSPGDGGLCLYTGKRSSSDGLVLYLGRESRDGQLSLYIDPVSGVPINFIIPQQGENMDFSSIIRLLPINTPTIDSVAIIVHLNQSV